MSVSPDDVIARARKRFETDLRDWALGATETASLDVPLHPPAEREVIADLSAATRWVDTWRSAEARLPIQLEWVTKTWSRVGRQSLPARARVVGVDAFVELCGEHERWTRWSSRVAVVRTALGDRIDAALRAHLRTLGELDETDFARLVAAVRWLCEHPESGHRIRELPIRGIDTKWLERHRAAVETLTLSVTGRDNLGLNERVAVGRIRMLDPDMSVGGLTDISAPIDDLASLALRPDSVLIVENLQTFLSVPRIPGAIAVDGHGDSIAAIARIPWVISARVVYWGDLDSHGLRILDRARAAGLEVESVLMDAQTLHEHRDLWVDEPKPFLGTPSRLTDSEAKALAELRAAGFVRLEQERIPWRYALEHLSRIGLAVAPVYAGSPGYGKHLDRDGDGVGCEK